MHEQEIPVQWRYKLDHSRWSEWLECDFRETGTYSGRVEFRRKPPPTSGEAVAVACQQSAAPRLRAVYTSPIGDPVHLGTLRAGRYMLPNLGIRSRRLLQCPRHSPRHRHPPQRLTALMPPAPQCSSP